MSAPYVIETSGLTKRFGERVAVDDVDLRVPPGSAFGYLGPNGAGKTTLIRMLLGLTRATSGTMRLFGQPVPAERAAALARVGAIARRMTASKRRSRALGSACGRTSAFRPNRSGCASASGSRAHFSPAPSS